jgi:RHS repeat-associated protein
MVAPFAPEMAGQSDPRRPPLVGHKIFPKRPLWQTYRYDWLGNTTRTDDDRHAFYDRSLGDVTQGAAGKPYQLTNASQPAAAGPDSGSISQVTYDAAGNLTFMQVSRTATECDSPGKCALQRLKYQWDEVGRLYRAEQVGGPIFFYLYDCADQRIVREDATATLRKQTLYVFDSLEIRGTQLDSGNPDEYLLTAQNEVPYLGANGMRLGRVVKEPATADAGFKGEPQLSLASGLPPSLHVFLTLPDHLGSASLIIDKATSELVEARTYQPYGATESDYRPDRWKGFREDYGFTGKEEDVEVGLIYFGKRFLSPYLGRWISADPLAVHVPGRAELNLYAYVTGQVLRATDPVGLETLGGQEVWGDGVIPPAQASTEGGEIVTVGMVIEASPPPVRAQPKPPPPPINPDLLPSVPTGPLGQARDELFAIADKSDNGLEVGIGFTLGCFMYCVATFEEVPRLIANAPSNGANAGQHFARASLQDDGLELTLDLLRGVEASSQSASGMLAVAAPAYALSQPKPQIGYRAMDPQYAASTEQNGFYVSGTPGRLGNDGVYVNTTIEGATAEFAHHRPGLTPAIFEVKIPPAPRLTLDMPPSTYYSSPLPFTQGYSIIQAPSLRAPETMNLLIRSGATPGKRLQ